MSDKILIFLESSTSGHLFVREAINQGYRAKLISDREARYRNLAGENVEVCICDTSDFDEVASVIAELRQSAPIAGILSTSGAYAAMAARLCRKFGLSGGNPEAIGLCQNKFSQREVLKSAGLICPKYVLLKERPHPRFEVASLGSPTIVKPVVGSGSIGVRLCFGKDEIQRHVDKLFEGGCADGVLLEEFVEGPEFSVETIGRDVLGITKKHLGGLPYFVEVGHDFPAVLPQNAAAAITDTVLAALTALNLGWGPAHTELRLTSNGPTIIEVNPRMGGDMIPELVRLATGVDAVAQAVRLVTGRELHLQANTRRHAAIRFLSPADEGIVRWKADVDRAMTIPDVSEVELYVEDGTTLSRRGDYRDRIGHVIVAGTTRHHVDIALTAALAHLCYDIDPMPT